MTLFVETEIRTPSGLRTIGSFRTGDKVWVYDRQNRPVLATVGLLVELKNPHRVSYQARWGPYVNPRSSYIADIDHTLVFYGTSVVKPKVQKGYVRRPYCELVWWTRCSPFKSTIDEAADEAAALAALSIESPSPSEADAPASISSPSAVTGQSGDDVAADSVAEAPSPTSISSADAHATDLSDEDSNVDPDFTSQHAPSSDVDMAPLSSEGWRADESFSSADSEAIQTRLEEGACDCGGLRPMSRSFPTAEIAQHYLAAALSPIASELLDPLIITPGEELKMTIRAYLNSSHTGGANVALKMPLVKFEELAAIDGAKLEDMPLHPYFYGAWLGDGTHNQPSITASAADVEMKRFLEDMRDDLNASPSRPAGSTPVHLYITETAGVSAPNLVMTIRGKEGQGPLVWSPVRRALQDLGVFANHKCNGIPAVFKNANEEVRAMVLAGLIDTDGSLTQQLAYVIGQSVAHRVIIDDARALALSLGIQVSEVRPTLRSGRFYNGHWIAESHGFAFEMSGPALRKLQPYILLPRKRLADDLEHHWYDKDGRAVQIEPLNPSTPLYGRELHMPGREMPLIQHKDGYVLSAK